MRNVQLVQRQQKRVAAEIDDGITDKEDRQSFRDLSDQACHHRLKLLSAPLFLLIPDHYPLKLIED